MTETLIQTETERHQAIANAIKKQGDVLFPALTFWNYEACSHHTSVGPQVDCAYRSCGGELFAHQRVGTAWLYAIKHGLLADDPGTGKTSSVLALIALLKQNRNLSRRAVIIPNTPAIKQWAEEVERWTKGLSYIVVDGSIPQSERINLYASEWDIAIVGSHIAVKDQDLLIRLGPFDVAVSDDVDPILSHGNATHRAIKAIFRGAERSFTVNRTTLQTRIDQLHRALAPVGGESIFGPKRRFKLRYEDKIRVWEDGRARTKVVLNNSIELKSKISPVYLRRKATELSDIRMPMLMPPQFEYFEMSPRQRAKYTELQNGVLALLRDGAEEIKYPNALAQFQYGQMICAGLPALGEPDGPEASPKLDRLFHNLEGVWSDRKTVVFVKNVGMVKAVLQRAKEKDIGVAVIWGQKQNADQRTEQRAKFWNDPDCRFVIGTASVERSLNLQCANTVVALDTWLNPRRMHQLLGRVKRAGSPHDRVFMFTYLMADSQETRYLQILRERQALSDFVFDNQSDLYESLTPTQLLQLIRP